MLSCSRTLHRKTWSVNPDYSVITVPPFERIMLRQNGKKVLKNRERLNDCLQRCQSHETHVDIIAYLASNDNRGSCKSPGQIAVNPG